MAMAMTEEMSASVQRGLSEWWSEETEYVFQRIERWAALARGYNRLRSQRLSRGRLTMQEEQEPRWSISSNKIVIEDPNWCPRFHNLRRSHRRKSRNDENCRINCCGTLNYQSSSNIDSNCLENYRYDHSIYFKTIGDIKSSKRETLSCKNNDDDDNDDDENSFSDDEQIEWKPENPNNFFDDCNFNDDENDVVSENEEYSNKNGNVCLKVDDFTLTVTEPEENCEINLMLRNVWPIVDLTKLSLDVNPDDQSLNIEPKENKIDECKISIDSETSNDDANNNNNFNDHSVDTTQKMVQFQIGQLTAAQTRRNSTIESTINLTGPQNNHEVIRRISSMRKSRKSPRKVRQPAVIGDNNVMWPGVLLNYTKNVEKAASSPHHHRAVQVK